MRELAAGAQERVAPNIYRTQYGWRVYVRRAGKLKPVRFPPETKLEELKLFVDQFKLDSKRLRRGGLVPTAIGGFATDAAEYLALPTVKAMPSLAARTIEIAAWVTVFQDRPRHTITARDIGQQLQTFHNEGYSGSTVNKFRTALMSLWTQLDGRSAANPVKDTAMFDETPMTARGQSYDLLRLILDSIPHDFRRPIKGVKGSRKGPSPSRARLEVLAWTGMDPSQMMRMNPKTDVSVKERWYITPARQKGSRRRRTPRPAYRKPMVDEAVPAFKRALALGLLGKKFSTHALLKTWLRAIARLQARLREELEDDSLTLPHIRLKDLRHSFGTRVYETTQSRETAGMMLDHAPGSPMTLRYTLGAVPNVLRQQMKKFDGPAPRKRKPERKVG